VVLNPENILHYNLVAAREKEPEALNQKLRKEFLIALLNQPLIIKF
jgi:hypothetical protein